MRGDRVKKVREELGFTQEDLAEKIGVAVLQVNRYENNKTEPSGDTVGKIAVALDVSTDYLLGLTDNPTPVAFSNTPLSGKERAIIGAVRQGNVVRAIKVILEDE